MTALAWWQRYRRPVLVLLFLGALIGLVHGTDLNHHFNLAFLRQTLSESGLKGLALFVFLFVLGNLVQIPGWIFLASAVLVLGKWTGGLVTYLAASISCAVTFLSVRWVGGDTVLQLQNPLVQRLMRQLHVQPIRNLIVLRTLFQTLAAIN